MLKAWNFEILTILALASGLFATPWAMGQAPAGPAIPRQFPVLPSRFSGGAGQFSGPINSVVPEIRPVPSLDYFPGTSIPTIRGLWTGTVPNGPGAASSDVFGSFYANPMAATRPFAFGAPLYDLAPAANAIVAPSATNSQTPYSLTATSSATTVQQTSADIGVAPNSATVAVGNGRAASVSAVSPRESLPQLRFVSPAAVTHTPKTLSRTLQVRDELQRIIDRSSTLSPRDSIRVLGDGVEVILRGTVTSQNDRQMAEALIRLSPGVQSVRNELAIGR
jgi:hypothetical protein